MSPTSLHSTTATWNWRGRQITARKLSKVCEMNPTDGVCSNKVRAESAMGTWWSLSHTQANNPTATMAINLITDSSAIASIMPRWCSVASTWRVPNKVANNAINSATYKAGSAKMPRPALLCPVSTSRLIATALYCSARYGTMPTSAITATNAASRRERP